MAKPPSSLISRRASLGLLGAGGLASGLALPSWSKILDPSASDLDLDVRRARFSILEGTQTDGLVSTRDNAPPPVMRMKRNQPFRVAVTNRLADYTSMHWHGLRLTNAMDGVPYLTQFPIAEGERFVYDLFSPDAGTFWYHPHCMTMEQMARGLTGILVVEEDEDPGVDTELALNLKDFRLNGQGGWIDLWTARGAARGGSFGTVMTTNWRVEPRYQAPTGGLVRLRIAATDTTRIYRLFLPDAEGRVIALDGHPLPQPADIPKSEQTALFLAPGQRADIVVRKPTSEVQTITHAPHVLGFCYILYFSAPIDFVFKTLEILILDL